MSAATLNESELKQALKDWIIKTSGRITAGELTYETMIFEQRVITSLQGLDFVMHMEKLIGKPIDISNLTINDFRNIDTIYRGVLKKVIEN